MGAYDTRGGSPLHDPAADHETPIGPLEEEVLTELEAMDQHYAAWSATRDELSRLFARVVSAWIRPGVVLDSLQRGKRPPCLWTYRLAGGTSRKATSFRVVSEPKVEVASSGDPGLSYWTCDAIPISPTTGKDMSGKPSGARGRGDTVTLRGLVFVSLMRDGATAQDDRDDFTRMVAESERILSTCPECGTAMTWDKGSAATRDEPEQAPAMHCLNCGAQVPFGVTPNDDQTGNKDQQ